MLVVLTNRRVMSRHSSPGQTARDAPGHPAADANVIHTETNSVKKRAIRTSGTILLVLVLAQCATWLLIGRRSFTKTVAHDIQHELRVSGFLDESSLESVPSSIRTDLREELLAAPYMDAAEDLPPDNRTFLYKTGDGRSAYSYEIAHVDVSIQWNPIRAHAHIVVYNAPLGAAGYEVEYYWVFGAWIRNTTANPKWIS